MKLTKIRASLAALIVFFLLGATQVTRADDGSQADALPIEDLRLFAEIFSMIKSDYVEPIDDATLLRDAVRGMLGGLDPHSSFLDPDSFHEINVDTRGEFGGLGIEVTLDEGVIRVVAPIDGTPADRAGIESGDLIIRLDGKTVKGNSLESSSQSECCLLYTSDAADE